MRVRGCGARRSQRRNLAQIATLGGRIGRRPACCNCSSASVDFARRLADERPLAIQPTIPNGSSGGITTGKPTGYLRTGKQYENFIAEFDWMHVPPQPGAVGNSGFFVWADPIPANGTGYTRGVEVQVLVNLTHKNTKGEITATSQGDLFSIRGVTCVPDRPHPDGWARCLPSENHTKGEREWNHYRVVANDGRTTNR